MAVLAMVVVMVWCRGEGGTSGGGCSIGAGGSSCSSPRFFSNKMFQLVKDIFSQP